MVLPAAEGTTQIPATCVPGMREKPNPAVSAVCDTTPKLGMGLQDRVQRGLILPDKRTGAVLLVPIRAKREKSLDGYGKKARFSVMMRIDLCTPSSYPIDANASRGRARFFVRYGKEPPRSANTDTPPPIPHPGRSACRVNADSLRAASRNDYLKALLSGYKSNNVNWLQHEVLSF
jgi:hypothetical protein